MRAGLVKLDYLFRNHQYFPWDALGLQVPYYGSLESYICDGAAMVAAPEERAVLIQHPTLREIKRLSRLYKGTFEYIETICEKNNDVRCRFAKARIVINWLDSLPGFRDFAQVKLDNLWRQGLLYLPEGARPTHATTT